MKRKWRYLCVWLFFSSDFRCCCIFQLIQKNSKHQKRRKKNSRLEFIGKKYFFSFSADFYLMRALVVDFHGSSRRFCWFPIDAMTFWRRNYQVIKNISEFQMNWFKKKLQAGSVVSVCRRLNLERWNGFLFREFWSFKARFLVLTGLYLIND